MIVREFKIACLYVLPALFLAFVAALLVSCSAPQDSSSHHSSNEELLPNVTWSVAPSLEEQVYRALKDDSLVVVRASLQSATERIETVPAASAVSSTTYRPVHELRFTIHEYLEGSGPNEILVVVRDDGTFSAEEDARAWANLVASNRNTSWDTHQAVLFVGLAEATPAPTGDNSNPGSSSVRKAAFSGSTPQQSPWDYTVDTLSRAWLPAETTASGTADSAADPAFITDGGKSPPPTIALSALRSKIATLKAELKSGEGIAGFEECIRGRILRERIDRAEPPWQRLRDKALTSSMAAGTEIYRYAEPFQGDPAYSRMWLKGPDASLFQTVTIDSDSSPANGYNLGFSTARPLPADTYHVHNYGQHYSDIPCDFRPDNRYTEWSITVTAPTGTLHEAFFDPVAIGTTIGADATNGVLKPNTFTASDSTTTTLRSIDYSGSNVRMLFSQTTGLSGKEVQFIMVDGTVGLTVLFSSATTETVAGKGTRYSWKTCSAPWAAGEKVMIRIRNTSGSTGSTPSCIGITPTPDPNATATPIPPPTATPEPTATPTLTPTPAPSAPGSVTPTLKAGNGQMTVSWSPPADNGSTITAYQVQVRQHPGGTWTVRATVSGQARSVKIDKLTPGMVYRVRLRAQNGVGWGKYSWPIPQVTLP